MRWKGLKMGVLGLLFAGCSQVRSAATGECVGQRPVTVVMIDGSATQADDGLLAEQADARGRRGPGHQRGVRPAAGGAVPGVGERRRHHRRP